MLKAAILAMSVLVHSACGTPITDDAKIREIRSHLNFDLYVPSYYESATNYEIKAPTDPKSNTKRNEGLVRTLYR
jgi:hypothetical protein